MKNILKLSVFLIFTVSAAAQLQVPGTVDRAFGRNGVLNEIPPTGTTYTIQTVLTQPDGKIIAVAGESIDGATPNQRFALIRYERNGSRDWTFGTDGISAPPFNSDALPYAAVLQPDGKILVAGVILANGSGDSILARYMPNGSLDSSFGNGGFVTTDTSTKAVLADERIHNVFVQSDGKIVLVGFQRRQNRSPAQYLPGNVLAFRYTPDGSLDPSFGNGGISLTPMEGEEVSVLSALNGTEGHIVISARELNIYPPTFRRLWVIILNADGSLRNQFPQGPFSRYGILAIDELGEVVFSDGPRLFTLKFDGYLNGIFYAGTPVAINGYDFSPGDLVMPNSLRFISVGTASTSSGNFRGLVRFDMSGRVDRSYGANGIGVGPLLTSRTFVTPVLQPDGGIIDMANLAPELGFKLVRYSGDPQ